MNVSDDRRQNSYHYGLGRRTPSLLEQITVTKATAKAPNPTLDAIAITALAKSQKPDKHRNLLEPGMHQCAFTVFGTVDKQKWASSVNGVLTIAPDSAPVATSTTPWGDLLQSALCSMSAKERQAWLSQVAAGNVPGCDCGPDKADAVAAEIEPALSAYRAAHPSPKRGTVSFTPTAAAE